MTPLPGPTDQRIADLRSTLERTRANLVELDADVTRKTLESSGALEGRTADAWAQTSLRFTALWQGQLALDTLLEDISAARGTKPSIPKSALGRLHQLLDGKPVALARSGPAAASRSLTEGTAPTDLLSIDEVIARMSIDYEAVVAVIDAVGVVWTDILPELDALQTSVTELEAVVLRTGGHRPGQLGAARRIVDENERLARRDPLSLSPGTVASVRATVEEAARPIQEMTDAVREAAGELQAVQASLDHCREALASVRMEHDRHDGKVAVSDDARAARDGADAELVAMQEECDVAGRMAEARPVEARRVIARLVSALAGLEATIGTLGSTEATGVAARDELRGRLAALRAKAQAMGRGEDPQLDRIHDQARDILFSAPCDLRRAETLVAEFQRTLRSTQAGTA